MTLNFWKHWTGQSDQHTQHGAAAGSSKPFAHVSDESSMVSRNPAPDASQSSEPTPGRTFTVAR